MMSVSSNDNPYYFLRHVQHEYFTEGDSEKGILLGGVCVANGSYGKEVDKETLLKLVNYKEQTKEERQKEKEGGKKHNNGIQFVFSPPKDWSIVLNMLDDDKREKMNKAFDGLKEEMVKTIQQNTYYRKKVKGKMTYELAQGIEVAAFTHHTARSVDDHRPDPQEHIHFLISPFVTGQDGKKYKHTLKGLIREKGTDKTKSQETLHYFDQVGQAYLAKFLKEELNLNVVRGVNDSFKVDGITDEQRKNFSKRNEKVKDDIGHDATPAERQKKITKSRNSKVDYDMKELREIWQNEMKDLELNLDTLQKGQKDNYKSFKEAFQDIRFISEKQIKMYALSESKFSKKSFERLYEEYKSSVDLMPLLNGNYLNLSHPQSIEFKKNYDKANADKLLNKLGKVQKGLSNTKENQTKSLGGVKNAETMLRELEAEHQAKIIDLTSSKGNLGKLAEEVSRFEARKNELLQQMNNELTIDYDFSM